MKSQRKRGNPHEKYVKLGPAAVARPAAVKLELKVHSWEDEARSTLRSYMRRHNVSFKTLAARLAERGVKDSQVNLSNKVGRGKFSLAFFMQCCDAMGIDLTGRKKESSQPAGEKG